MTIGIYKLVFNGTDKVYIGQAVDCNSRLTRHIREMRQEINSKKLNQAFKDFGAPTLEILEVVPNDICMDTLENYYIFSYDTVNTGFNSAERAGGGCSLQGENHPLAQHSNIELENALKYIIDNPKLTVENISKKLGISIRTISGILKQSSNLWLAKACPESWSKLTQLRVYKNRGEHKGSSKTSNEDIILVLRILTQCPDIPYKEVAEFTGVSIDSINALAKGAAYNWLAEEFNEEYMVLMSLKGSRSRHVEVGKSLSVSALGIKYPKIISPSGNTYKVDNISAFAREYSLDKSTLHRLLNRQVKQHKGWKVCQEEQVS